MCGAREAFLRLSETLGCATAVMPDAKSFFPEDHPNFIGTFWGNVSSPGACEIIESSDIAIFVGPVFTDYSTVGYSTLLKKENFIEVRSNRVKLPNAEYGCVYMAEFLEELSKVVQKNDRTLACFNRFKKKYQTSVESEDSPLTTSAILQNFQKLLTPTTCVIVETGDAWFHGQRLRLPVGCTYEKQMQYGSIGWSVGAVLGYAAATVGERRVIALIGDGSFQMTAQEISTIIRYKYNPIIFLLNNKGYTIEVEIHDGPYNDIKNWDYAKLVDVFNNGETNAVGTRVNNEKELKEAIQFALNNDHLTLIECNIDRHDCTPELLEWGSRVSSANGRRPVAGF
jgi:pyruvate decarboxylase